MPKDLPPKMLWGWALERTHHALYVESREREGRRASQRAVIIDSQSARAAQYAIVAISLWISQPGGSAIITVFKAHAR